MSRLTLSNPIRVRNPLDIQQRDQILALLAEKLRRDFPHVFVSGSPMTKRERAADRVLKARNNRIVRQNRATEKRREKFANKVRNELLFGDVRKALAMVR